MAFNRFQNPFFFYAKRCLFISFQSCSIVFLSWIRLKTTFVIFVLSVSQKLNKLLRWKFNMILRTTNPTFGSVSLVELGPTIKALELTKLLVKNQQFLTKRVKSWKLCHHFSFHDWNFFKCLITFSSNLQFGKTFSPKILENDTGPKLQFFYF